MPGCDCTNDAHPVLCDLNELHVSQLTVMANCQTVDQLFVCQVGVGSSGVGGGSGSRYLMELLVYMKSSEDHSGVENNVVLK